MIVSPAWPTLSITMTSPTADLLLAPPARTIAYTRTHSPVRARSLVTGQLRTPWTTGHRRGGRTDSTSLPAGRGGAPNRRAPHSTTGQPASLSGAPVAAPGAAVPRGRRRGHAGRRERRRRAPARTRARLAARAPAPVRARAARAPARPRASTCAAGGLGRAPAGLPSAAATSAATWSATSAATWSATSDCSAVLRAAAACAAAAICAAVGPLGLVLRGLGSPRARAAGTGCPAPPRRPRAGPRSTRDVTRRRLPRLDRARCGRRCRGRCSARRSR